MKTDPRLEQAARDAMRLYGDIIRRDPPEPDPVRHPRLSMEQRAAQFLPFSALKGYEDAVEEEARLTVARPELDEDRRQELDRSLHVLAEKKNAEAMITWFEKDTRKEGGEIRTVSDTVHKVDSEKRVLILSNRNQIAFENILEIVIS